MNKPVPRELVDELERLDDEAVARVVAYAKSLNASNQLAVRNEKLREIIGSISKEDIVAMNAAIEEGCEQVDHETW